ncbi:hypothetical protein C8R45DRAFT_918299 [Mycena sanguinolenta]|nr:hypothetical protein C8R45DRAFT_918299 [Mycena sanguinolenta]
MSYNYEEQCTHADVGKRIIIVGPLGLGRPETWDRGPNEISLLIGARALGEDGTTIAIIERPGDQKAGVLCGNERRRSRWSQRPKMVQIGKHPHRRSALASGLASTVVRAASWGEQPSSAQKECKKLLALRRTLKAEALVSSVVCGATSMLRVLVLALLRFKPIRRLRKQDIVPGEDHALQIAGFELPHSVVSRNVSVKPCQEPHRVGNRGTGNRYVLLEAAGAHFEEVYEPMDDAGDEAGNPETANRIMLLGQPHHAHDETDDEIEDIGTLEAREK